MNFFKYLGVTEDEFVEKYLNPGLVTSQKHPTLPLVVFCYGRKAVYDNVWDDVTSKCRGIVIDIISDEVIARPFEKFHNFGSTVVEGLTPESNSIFAFQPVIWEKMDGFMITAFFYRGEWHAASKCSFTSVHAKWATAELRRKMAGVTTTGTTTLVFEGLHPSLRIVVDYKRPAELVLLTVIDNETGAELTPDQLRETSNVYGFNVPDQHVSKTWQEMREETGVTHNSYNEEGYVLTWYREGTTPFRLKMKYIDYLRLHRMVTGVSPKRIWEVLSQDQTTELNDYLANSTPWFSKFVTKWMHAFQGEFLRLETEASRIYFEARADIMERFGAFSVDEFSGVRKAFAEHFTKYPQFSGICFAMLDRKDVRRVIWKQVRKMAVGNPMVDSHSL
jgi:RNA ligase